MILLNNIVEIPARSDPDGRFVRSIVPLNRCGVAATLVNGDLLWEPLGANRLGQKGRGRSPITSRRQQEVYREALLSTARYKCPLPFDAHVSLIHPPACPHRLVPTTELLLKLRAIFDDPAVEHGVIDPDAPLLRHLFELPVGIGYVTYYSRNDCL